MTLLNRLISLSRKKWKFRLIVSIAGLAALLLIWLSPDRAWPVSDHYDGKRFFNPGFSKDSSVAGYLRLRLTMSQPDWPEKVVVAERKLDTQPTGGESLRVTMIGHATLLIEIGGLIVLTDPIWSERASPLPFAGPRRVVSPAMSLEALPPIDMVLISHNHYDHLDLYTLRKLDELYSPRVIVPLGNLSLVSNAMPSSEVTEHDWGERISIGNEVRVSVVPVLHGSGRSLLDQQQSLWAGYVVDSSTSTLFFVGDAAFGDGQSFKEVRDNFSPIDIIALPIGAYAPTWFMGDSHMTPSEALEAFRISGARYAIGHHFDTFQLGFEEYGAAPNLVDQLLSDNDKFNGQFQALKTGEVFVPSAEILP